MKTECIYVDDDRRERILYIDELVTVEYSNDEIHYMNNDSRLFREVRRASREHRSAPAAAGETCSLSPGTSPPQHTVFSEIIWTPQTQTAATTRAP